MVKINNKILPVESSIKNLGVLLDSHLKFSLHVNKLIQRSYYTLKLLYSNRHLLNFKLKNILVDSLVLSVLNYCDFVYGPCLDSADRNRIQKIQNACCRFLYDLKKYDHISIKIKESKWLTMQNRRKLHLLCLTHSILKTSTPTYLKNKLIFRNTLHAANVRYNYLLNTPNYRTTTFRKSFTYNAVLTYNSLPLKFKNLNLSFKNFKFQVRKYLLDLQ